jgi:ABC-type dipeptide/oligopeptide/nickel transport system permease component
MGLERLIAKRIALAVPTIMTVLIIIFAVTLLLTPTMRLYMFITHPRDLLPQNLQNLIHQHGLDQPILVQFANWLGKIAVLDFGVSLHSNVPAMDILIASMPTTLELVLYSVPLIIFFGIWLGTKAALNHNKKLDHIARLTGLIGASFPAFVLGEVLIAMFLAQFGFYAASAGGLDYNVRYDLIHRIQNGTFTQYTGMTTIDALLNGDAPVFVDALKHLVFPVAILVFTQTALLMRVTRAGVLEESSKTYFTSAMAKGLSKKETVYKHARKNALISVLTVSGLLLGNMLTTLAIVETVFNRPGFAYTAVNSARLLDTPVVFASTTIIVIAYILMNLVIDILYMYVDRRIKLA